MDIKPGSRWRSVVCDTEVIAVRAPKEGVSLACGGTEMVAARAEGVAGASLDPAHADGTLLGKRYADEVVGIEVLCVKAGAGSLTVDGEPLPIKDARPLPASD